MMSKRYGTLLSDTPQYRQRYAQLHKDGTSGKFASSVQISVPEEFDGRVTWKRFFKPIRNQHNCGACWAFSSCFVLQTRLSIYTNGRYHLDLSPSKMVLCNLGMENEYKMAQEYINQGLSYDFTTIATMDKKKAEELAAIKSIGCNGETLLGAWAFLYTYGTPEESCITYSDSEDDFVDLTTGEATKSCGEVLGFSYDQCPTNKRPAVFHQCANYYWVPGAPQKDPKVTIPGGTEFNIRRDIFHWGPCTTGFTVHQDFLNWDGQGIYKWDGKSSPDDGGHAVVLVGWGTDPISKTPYWIVRNSWGPEWGDNGYFKFLRGQNHCGIEENIVVGYPNMFGFRNYVEFPVLFRPEDAALKAIWGVKDNGLKATTIEKAVVGTISSIDADTIDRFRYDPTCWADVSVFVAGNSKTWRYNIKRSSKRYTKAAVFFFGGAVVGGLVIFLLLKNKRRLQ